MDKRKDKPWRVMVVAGSSARRLALAELAVRALNNRVHITSGSQISVERFNAAAAEILIADLDTPALAENLLKFLEEVPGGTGTIALIDDPDAAWVRSALGSSVNAILARDAGPEDLLLAVQAAEAGLILLHPTSVRGLAAQHVPQLADATMSEELTGRECQVLRLVSEGCGNKEIAAKLAISEHTVKFHISSILGKLNVSSRTEAVSQGIRQGLIPI